MDKNLRIIRLYNLENENILIYQNFSLIFIINTTDFASLKFLNFSPVSMTLFLLIKNMTSTDIISLRISQIFNIYFFNNKASLKMRRKFFYTDRFNYHGKY